MKTKRIPQTLLILSLAAFTPLAYSAETQAEKSADKAADKADKAADKADKAADKAASTNKGMVKKGSLTSMIADSATFSTLTKALVAAELDATLGADGEYTIFAPTDEAFGKLSAETLAKLMLPENKEKLRSLLMYHVVAGKVLAADLKDGDVKSLNGEKLKVDVSDDKVEINDNKVFSADVRANNGVMHTIGTVMVPKSLDGFVGLDK